MQVVATMKQLTLNREQLVAAQVGQRGRTGFRHGDLGKEEGGRAVFEGLRG